MFFFFFFSSRRRHTRYWRDWSSDVCSSDLFDVVMRLGDQDRSTSGLGDLLIGTPTGRVPLRLVADVTESDEPNQILRENSRRRLALLSNTDGTRDMAGIVADIRRAIDGNPCPQGYSFSLEGTFQAQEE